MDFAVPENHRVKINDSEYKDKYLDLASKIKTKSVENEGYDDTNCSWCAWNGTQSLGKKIRNWKSEEKSWQFWI